MADVELPEGWRIVRDERTSYLDPDRVGEVAEVTFAVVRTDDDYEATKTSAVYLRREGEWSVRPGMQTSRLYPDEARARAAALVMAAEEVERRSAR